MAARRFLVGAALLLSAVSGGTPRAAASVGPAPPGGSYRISLVAVNPSAAPLPVAFRARLSGGKGTPIPGWWNTPPEWKFKSAWSSVRSRLDPGEMREFVWEFPVGPDAPALLAARVQVRGKHGWRDYEGRVLVDDGGSYRLRTARSAGEPIPFRVLAATDGAGGLPLSGAVARTSDEWDALRGSLGLLAPESWGVSQGGPYPFGGQVAVFHTDRGPDLSSETVLAVVCPGSHPFGYHSILAVDRGEDGTVRCSFSFLPGACIFPRGSLLPEPSCFIDDVCLLVAIPRTDGQVEFLRVGE